MYRFWKTSLKTKFVVELKSFFCCCQGIISLIKIYSELWKLLNDTKKNEKYKKGLKNPKRISYLLNWKT